MNCTYCQHQLIKITQSLHICDNCFFKKAKCNLCGKAHKCHVIYHLIHDVLIAMQIGIVKTNNLILNPKYLGPMDTKENPYIDDRILYSVRVNLNKNTTDAYKDNILFGKEFDVDPVFTISGVNKITPCNFEEFVAKFSLYTTFS